MVTGAGRGLGRTFALALARRGASVVVNDIGISRDADRYSALQGDAASFGADAGRRDVADSVVGEIRTFGGEAVASRADVSDPQAAATMVNDAIEHYGRMDIIINNAGIVIHGDFASLTSQDLQAALGVHVAGAFHVTNAAWPTMQAQQYGRVLNVGSVAGVVIGVPRHAVYDAAKGGLAGLTLSLAAEGGPHGIRVNCLLPSADTRCSMSVHRAYSRPPGLTTEVVGPAACWLVHEDCPAQGNLYMAGGGRMARVFTAIAEGYQAPDLSAFSPEAIREHWLEIDAVRSAFVPPDAAALSMDNAEHYRRSVGGREEVGSHGS
jgi:NAD(P)-dependent dehydrogenase (short-subunit alcohol dehydrogenase family)